MKGESGFSWKLVIVFEGGEGLRLGADFRKSPNLIMMRLGDFPAPVHVPRQDGCGFVPSVSCNSPYKVVLSFNFACVTPLCCLEERRPCWACFRGSGIHALSCYGSKFSILLQYFGLGPGLGQQVHIIKMNVVFVPRKTT
jgi:hypothetical protein